MLEQLSEIHSYRPGQRLARLVYRFMLCATQCVDPIDYRIGFGAGRFVVWRSAHRNRFCLAGMGAWVVTSIQALDFPAVMGFAVVVSFAYVLVNLVVDLLYLWIDPRIGRGGGE